MLYMNSDAHQKITVAHLHRKAYLYVRQSTLRQVFENTESTKRQYGLRERAVALGWPFENIVVIDSDLGQSGADSDREGFQKLVAAVGLGEVGVVLGLEVSRLARSSSDWHRLLEICALTDTLILDEDGLYNPAHFNDRLLLGLKGTMSEAELHVLRARLLGGQRAKASRGELEMRLPVGFVYDSAGKVVLDPYQQVQDTLRKFFDTFRQTGSATATVRSLRQQGLLFPRRMPTGPNKGELVWGQMLHNRALRALKNPRYAGAFVYGRTKTKTIAGKYSAKRLPREQWHTLILDAHPGFISWAEYEENLRRLHENAQANGADRRKSPPREGPSLLQGLAVCGRCGTRMSVRYYVRHGELVPEYVCQRDGIDKAEPICQRVVGRELDLAVGELLVESVTPLALEVTLAVQDELNARAEDVDRLRRQQVERARYDAELAQRRYLRVDPDNRLVADSLEADWNHKLRAHAAAQEDYERQRAAEGLLLDEAKRAEILALATDFPRLWRDPQTHNRDRKRIDRLLDEHTDAEIVDILNAKGFRPGVAERFSLRILYILRRTYDLEDRFTRLRRLGMLTLQEVCELLGADESTVKIWASAGHIASLVYNDKGQRLFERPTSLRRACQWCGGPISAKPSLRRGKKWCSPDCCTAAYKSRKRAAGRVAQQAAANGARNESAVNPTNEVQSVA